MACCVILTCCCCCSVRIGTFIIGTLSLIFSTLATAYFTLMAVALAGVIPGFFSQLDIVQNALEEDTEGQSEEGGRFWTIYNSAVSKWQYKIFWVSVGLASTHALTFFCACLLIHGARKAIGGLMIPWLITEALKTLAAIGFGVVLVGMAPSWAKKLGTAAANSNISWPTNEFVQALLMAHGVALIVVFLVGAYFFFVVLSHYREVKSGRRAIEDADLMVAVAMGVVGQQSQMNQPLKPSPYF